MNILPRLLYLTAVLAAQTATAQTATARHDTIPGYATRISGETIGYGSYTPMATQALLTRVNTGQDTITWETEAVPKNYNGDTVYFTWV
ncbi:MAG TPA: hypothetical protein VL547_18625, partial [Dinghuibacter sp.]|uniref:hypothetical protein n=1 Tax=Dinghuibacter sp. TaxID=2024697 RepID=UPI002D08714D